MQRRRCCDRTTYKRTFNVVDLLNVELGQLPLSVEESLSVDPLINGKNANFSILNVSFMEVCLLNIYLAKALKCYFQFLLTTKGHSGVPRPYLMYRRIKKTRMCTLLMHTHIYVQAVVASPSEAL
jgi:hypothetical protein